MAGARRAIAAVLVWPPLARPAGQHEVQGHENGWACSAAALALLLVRVIGTASDPLGLNEISGVMLAVDTLRMGSPMSVPAASRRNNQYWKFPSEVPTNRLAPDSRIPDRNECASVMISDAIDSTFSCRSESGLCESGY